MLRRDAALYRTLLRHLSWGDLVTLYERTLPHYATLAEAIAEELSHRLCDTADRNA
jgi:hypothetical protein